LKKHAFYNLNKFFEKNLLHAHTIKKIQSIANKFNTQK